MVRVDKEHHRCNICGEDFDNEAELERHIDRRHPEEDVHWWVVAENPEDLPFESS
ncbi:C2H2-type zinc finger protein [Halorutilales archaeon Cl-col2-1]